MDADAAARNKTKSIPVDAIIPLLKSKKQRWTASALEKKHVNDL
jgi:hypothetical protein